MNPNSGEFVMQANGSKLERKVGKAVEHRVALLCCTPS